MPVRPDVLGERLEAYAKVVPTLRTLRLCHRFGKDQQVHITKLPAEVELVIEGHVIRAHQRSPGQHSFCEWEDAFRHFEGRCAPVDHAEDPEETHHRIREGFSGDEICDSCEKGNWWEVDLCEKRCKPEDGDDKCETCSQTLDPHNCTGTCKAGIDFSVNHECHGTIWEDAADDDCKGWAKRIDKKGSFGQYETVTVPTRQSNKSVSRNRITDILQVLRQHFGLEVFFSTSRIAEEDWEHWPRDRNGWWHTEEKLKTTICYLTLSIQLAQKKTYEASAYEEEIGGTIEGTHAIVIKPGKINDEATSRKRFHRAMHTLCLEPYQHPSQRDTVVMSSCGVGKDAEAFVGEGSAAWPKLVIFAKVSHPILFG